MKQEILGNDYFGHPLTTATFDRTPEQRSRRTQLIVEETRDQAYTPEIVQRVNKAMFGEFVDDVQSIMAEKVNRSASVELGAREHPTFDTSAVRTLHLSELRREIAELHAAMPLPDLDRLVQHTEQFAQ